MTGIGAAGATVLGGLAAVVAAVRLIVRRGARDGGGRDPEPDGVILVPRSRSREDATRLVGVVLPLLREHADVVYLDAYSDYRDELPMEVEQAQDRLRQVKAARGERRRDPGMGIALDPRDDQEWSWCLLYAAWSIHVEFHAADRIIASIHDCTDSIDIEDAALGREILDHVARAGIELREGEGVGARRRSRDGSRG